MHFGPTEDAVIRENYITMRSEEIAKLLGSKKNSVTSRAQRLMRMDDAFKKVVSQRVAEKNLRKVRAAVASGRAKLQAARTERLFGGPLKPVLRDASPVMVTLPKAPNRELRPVAGRSSEEMTKLAVERVARRTSAPKRRCSYFHFMPEKGRSVQCPEFAVRGSAWCPECAARIAELRASA